MPIKTFLLITVIIMSLLCVSCESNQNVSNNLDLLQQRESIFPDEVLEFHINHQRGEKVFVLTSHETPYMGYFQYIELRDTNELELVKEYSTISSKGIVFADITHSQREDLVNSLKNIQTDSNSPIQLGEDMLILSYSTSIGIRVVSCQNKNCPPAICAIYDLANTIIESSNKNYLTPVVCPTDGEKSK